MRNILLYDFREGTRKNLWKFALILIFTGIMCILFARRTEGMTASGRLTDAVLGMDDYLLYALGGMPKFIPARNHRFEVPVLWMTEQLLLSACVFSYPIQDLHSGRGCQILTRCSSRRVWWLGKCIWAIQQVIILYTCIIAGAMAAWLLTGNPQRQLNLQAFVLVEGVRLLSDTAVIWKYAVFPIAYSLMMSMLQINMSLVLNPVGALAAVVAYHVASAYLMTPLLLGNISMLYRNSMLMDTGVSPAAGAIACLIIMILGTCIGTAYFKKYNILK